MMQKWEYLQLLYNSTGRNFYIHRINDQEIGTDQERPSLLSYLNELGEQGWEIVSIGDGVALLKRPKPGTL